MTDARDEGVHSGAARRVEGLRRVRRAMFVALVVLACDPSRAAHRPIKPTPSKIPHHSILLTPPYVIGPVGHWSGQCPPQSAQPGTVPVISGCVTGYTFRPGSVDVSVQADGLGQLGSVTVLACQTAAFCPAASMAAKSGTALFSTHLSLPSPAGISRVCASASNFQPTVPVPGQPPTSPLKSAPLGCATIAPALTAAVAAFNITPSKDGLNLAGWFIDLATDAPARIVLGRGLTPSVTYTALADGVNAGSPLSWPGFSNNHGFTTVVPYVGAPGATQICAWLAASNGTALGGPLGCFNYNDRTTAFAEAHVSRGAPLHVSVRNVPSGAAVSVNLKADPSHFMLPWTNAAVPVASSDPTGAVDFTLQTEQLPPGQYVIAYHCSPDCPDGNINSLQLRGGGQPWTGGITWGPSVTIDPTVSRGLSVTIPMPGKVRVVGSGFRAGETVNVIVVPPVLYFEGFPHELAGNAATEADAQGTFSVDVDVTGLPITGPHNQVVVIDSKRVPVAATPFTAP